MKKLLLITFIACIASVSSLAQPGMQQERIHAAKMAYITDRLRLTAEENNAFLPIYSEYDNELRSMRQEFYKRYKCASANCNDEKTSRQFVDDDLDYQQRVLDLKRRYKDRFLKVISAEQLAELYKAEREFRQMLMSSWRLASRRQT